MTESKTVSLKVVARMLVLMAIVLSVAAVASNAAAAEAMRSGTVVATYEDGQWTLIQAKDASGKEFWVWAGLCAIGEGGQIEVVQGRHFDKTRSESLGKTLEDCYVAQLIRANGREVQAIAAHGLPEGCVVLN